jgi:TPR repeat protein
MKKYIPLMALALALSSPSLGHAQTVKPDTYNCVPPPDYMQVGVTDSATPPQDDKRFKEDKAYREKSVKTLDMYRKAAAQGNAYAQYMLAIYYDAGGTGLKRDDMIAMDWLRKSADQGYSAAQYDLGIAYHKGLWGVKKDEVEATKWVRKSADQDYCPATFGIGIAYYNGWGVKKDVKEATNLWLKATKESYPVGRYYLERCGGMKISDKQAGEWLMSMGGAPKCLTDTSARDNSLMQDMYRKAAAQGSTEAQEMLKQGAK